MTDDRQLEFEVEVPGTPEEVWRAIATGPGISSWYVPHTVTEEAGGAVSASFGSEPEMTGTGLVAVWEPLKRVRFTGEGGDDVGLAFEWFVEAVDGGSCVVRLVNSGFGTGEEWDQQYDGMAEGWPMFLTNLTLHLQHFAGQSGHAAIPGGQWQGEQDEAWQKLTAELGIAAAPAVGDPLAVKAADAPPLAGTVAEVLPWRLSVVLDEPMAGTAIIAAEAYGGSAMVSVWTYLYGPEAAAAAAEAQEAWGAWLAARS